MPHLFTDLSWSSSMNVQMHLEVRLVRIPDTLTVIRGKKYFILRSLNWQTNQFAGVTGKEFSILKYGPYGHIQALVLVLQIVCEAVRDLFTKVSHHQHKEC
jgi:hypothetical protein